MSPCERSAGWRENPPQPSKGNDPMERYRTDLAFKLAAPDEVRVYREGQHIGDIFKDEDILNRG